MVISDINYIDDKPAEGELGNVVGGKNWSNDVKIDADFDQDFDFDFDVEVCPPSEFTFSWNGDWPFLTVEVPEDCVADPLSSLLWGTDPVEATIPVEVVTMI